MDNIDKLPDDLKRWITPFIVYDENTTIYKRNPCLIEQGGKSRVLARTDGAMVVIDHPFAASLPAAPEALAAQVAQLLAADGARTLTVELRALQLWCGRALATAAEFDNDGGGPWFAPRTRSCTIFDARIDGNLLAHALAGFDGEGAVQISYLGPQERIVFALETGAVALMPLKAVARLDETGLHNPWDKEEADAEPEMRA